MPMIPAIGDEWSGYRLRPCQPDDADVISRWPTINDTESGGLDAAQKHAHDSDGACFVLERTEESPAVGVFSLWNSYLQFAYILPQLQEKLLGTKAGAVLLQHHFEKESVLRTDGNVTTAGEALLVALGFTGLELTRDAWERHKPELAELFE